MKEQKHLDMLLILHHGDQETTFSGFLQER